MKSKTLFFFLFFILFSFSSIATASNVLVVEINDTIDQTTVEIVKESIKQANSEKSEAIILLLKTPGGGLSQTFEIADLINESEIPFVGYVYPSGSAAWSAGTFILMSTHLAVMADNTIIGSCQPVEITATGTRYINESKTINALVKWIETRAEIYGRNSSTAALFIRKNLNLDETEALERGVIEFQESTIEKLLVKINGTEVTTSSGSKKLETLGVSQIKYSPSIGIVFMKFFSNPVLSSLLMIIGIFAIIFGIRTPGFGAEVFGVIAVLLSLIGSGFSIPILAIIFIILAVILLIIELFVTPGFGVIGIGGVISLIIGSIFLIPNYSNSEWLISMAWYDEAILIIVSVIALISVFFIFLLYKIIQVRKKKVEVGTFIGETAKTVDRLVPGKEGYVRFEGALWHAKSDEIIEPNTKVIIEKREDTVLKVRPKKD